MSTKNKAPSGQPWKVDELGVVTWATGTDPMVEVRESMPRMIDQNGQLAVERVHVTLSLARSVAVSLFGADWPDYVLDVYDRIKDVRDDFDHADDE
jgi:hypothetical protein